MGKLLLTTILKKFDEQGEKTGWTYIEINEKDSQKLNPGNKKSFRVRGKIDSFSFEKIALMPMGNGNFIMPVKANIRKAIHKQYGANVKLSIELDDQNLTLPAELAECFKDEPESLKKFEQLPKSHQHYFIRWISEAKTDTTKAKRIAQTLTALSRGLNFGEMLRNMKHQKADW